MRSKIDWKVQSTKAPAPRTHTASSTSYVSHQSGAFVTIQEPTWSRHYCPKSIVSIRVRSWCGHSVDSDEEHHSFFCQSYSSKSSPQSRQGKQGPSVDVQSRCTSRKRRYLGAVFGASFPQRLKQTDLVLELE